MACGFGEVVGINLCLALFTRMIAIGAPTISRFVSTGYVLVLVNAVLVFVASLVFVLMVKRTRWCWLVSV